MKANKTELIRATWMVFVLFLLLALLIWWWFEHRIEAIDATIEIIQTK